ncbi:MAG TPA: hypothetical protein VND24_05745, partial [Steroidobacteraceae bacterium]|nr:hypothetical protein [Steroidobacteraceae bacterium]
AELISRLAGAAAGTRFTAPAVGDDPQRRQPDITKARTMLGWEPETGLEEGLRLTIAYFRLELEVPGQPPGFLSCR